MNKVVRNKVVCASARVTHGRKVEEMFCPATLKILGRGEQLHTLSRCDLGGKFLKQPLHSMLHGLTFRPPRFHLPTIVLLGSPSKVLS